MKIEEWIWPTVILAMVLGGFLLIAYSVKETQETKRACLERGGIHVHSICITQGSEVQ